MFGLLAIVRAFPEKTMAPHSSTPAWKILWTEEPGRLQSMGSLRVRHDWVTSLSLFTSMHWRRKWQPTPVFLPGESQGWGSLVGGRLWGSHRVGHDWSDLAARASQVALVVKNLPANAGDSKRYGFNGEGHGKPLHYSFLENPMNRGAWWATIHVVTKS